MAKGGIWPSYVGCLHFPSEAKLRDQLKHIEEWDGGYHPGWTDCFRWLLSVEGLAGAFAHVLPLAHLHTQTMMQSDAALKCILASKKQKLTDNF